MRLPVLHLSVPDVPCALFVNGALVGQSADQPVLPVSPDGMVYISALPICTDRGLSVYPLTVCFSLFGGLPNTPVHGCRLYIGADGVIDVALSPLLLPQPPDTQPHTVDRALYTFNKHPHAATLYCDNGWRIAIEDIYNDILLICHAIRDFTFGHVQIVRCFTNADVHITGDGPIGPRSLLFTPMDGRYVLIADEYAQSVAGDHALVCTQPLLDTVGHEKRYTLTLQDNQPLLSEPVYGFFSKSFNAPDTPAAVCAALCEAVQLSLLDEALSCLSPELGEGMTISDLSGFFGPFDHVHSVAGEGPCTLSLAYVSYENVYSLQSYICEMDGARVSNITPME